jgi:hypothetical protein
VSIDRETLRQRQRALAGARSAAASRRHIYGGHEDAPALEDAPDELPERLVAEHDRERDRLQHLAERTAWPTERRDG